MPLIGLMLVLGVHVFVAAADSPRVLERALDRAVEQRTYYASGRLYQVRHLVDGREEGLQQAWTEEGELYVSYEMRNGRRYGYINARPCAPVTEAPAPAAPANLPYYDGRDFTPKWRPVSHEIADFDLVTQTGASIRRADLRGRVHVASFMFTSCAGICPALFSRLAKVQTALATRPGAVLLSFSVTPDVDTPGHLAAFGAARGIDPARWTLVTGDASQIHQLARASYFADDGRLDRRPSEAAPLLHTEKALLVDRHGRLRGVYNATLPYEIDKLIADLDALLKAGGR